MSVNVMTQGEGNPCRDSLRVFISYGHDEHASLAIRLRDDLRERGHEVWYDEERLRPGHDWERSIEYGIAHLAEDKSKAAVVLLLTPHSVRRPDGFCLNEVAHALSKGLRIVPVMVVDSEPPLSICRIQWLDMRECIPLNEKAAFYGTKFVQLCRALEERELDCEGAQSRLLSVLEPISFTADISKLLRDFTGRKWVFAEVDEWFHDPDGAKLFWITGAPGAGKSAIAAWIRDNRREIAAFHFCDINSEEKRNPTKLVRSIVYQLSTQLPAYRDLLARLPLESIVGEYHEAYTLFNKLMIEPLSDRFPKPDRPIVVLVDALDEASCRRQNEIVRFLTLCADKTPGWLRFLVTSRPEPEIVASFQGLSPYVLDTAKEENVQDLRAFVQARIPTIAREQIDTIVERSEGVFLYVKHVVDAIGAGHLSLARCDEFPRGLGDVYQHFFNRQFGGDLDVYEERITPILQPVLAAFEPLTLGFLKRQCGDLSETELSRCLNRLGSMFPIEGEGPDASIRPFHRSLCDWITNREAAGHYVIAASDGHRELAEHGWRQYLDGPERMDDYFIQWLPSHLLALEDEPRCLRLLADFGYLMEKVRRGMLEGLLADLRSIPDASAGSGEATGVERSFFHEKAHILRRGTAEWPAYKILLQLAMEYADESPLTKGAQQWVADGGCDWLWWRNSRRPSTPRAEACVSVLEGHNAEISGARALGNGNLVSWSALPIDTTLRVWDTNTGARLADLRGHPECVNGAMAVGRDGFLSWSWEAGAIRLWSASTASCVRIFEGHTEGVLGVLACGPGRFLSWSRDWTLRLWCLSSGACEAVFRGHSDKVAGGMVLSDGRVLSWSNDETLKLWDAATGGFLLSLEGHENLVLGAQELAGGRLLSWAWDGNLRLWDCETGTCLKVLKGHTKKIIGAAQLKDGGIISWGDRTLRLWDCDTGECFRVLSGHEGGIRGAMVLGEHQVASWSSDGTLRLWDVARGECSGVLRGHTAEVKGALKLAEDRLLSWSRDRTLRLWDSVRCICLGVLEGHTDAVIGGLLAVNGRLISWSWDQTLRLWNCDKAISAPGTGGVPFSGGGSPRLRESGSGVRAAQEPPASEGTERHAGAALGAVLLTNGRVASWSQDREIRLWDVASGKCLRTFSPETRPKISGLLALAGDKLLSWSGQMLRIWDGNEGVCELAVMGHVEGCSGAIRLQEGRFATWGGEALKVWDERGGTCISVLEGRGWGSKGFLRGARELPGGRLIAWSSRGAILIWDVDGRGSPVVLEGHTREVGVGGVSFLSGGRIASWSADGTIRIWHHETGSCCKILRENNEGIAGAAELQDHRLLSWSEDRETRELGFRVWDLERGECDEHYMESQAFGDFPNWRHMLNLAQSESCVIGDLSASSLARSACLWHKSRGVPLAAWHGESDAEAACLLPDGNLVVTQMNGEVCFLKLYQGPKRVSLKAGEVFEDNGV
ncbi:TIR domain-containing protein [Haloferula sp. A504]|uniref:TIR domain-containing protein n=1 Tax=Haloferula sp. A504 TaxID=3373601 RepID=UPI0031C9386E|nr:TIR domain-containing protein [Verrucomicrobiaceae bacterium E54]